MTKFIVVAGGVISGVGKGVTTASLGKILKEHGYNITLIKIDPYINFDAGTLRPTEHGEVWVTDDGGEIDQDLGTYERFIDGTLSKYHNITTGQIYKAVIDKERSGHYLGQTVQFIPHILDEITHRIKQVARDYEIAIIEIGGTVGDYENTPFLLALRNLEHRLGKDNVVYILVTYFPIPHHSYEMKTKPAQQAIKLLNEAGISPHFIICRAEFVLDEVRKSKIETYANLDPQRVISAPDVATVYQLPLDLEHEDMGNKLLAQLGLQSRKKPDWASWEQRVNAIKKPHSLVKVAIIGKYIDSGDFTIADSYLSVAQSLLHAGAECNTGVNITWLDAKKLEGTTDVAVALSHFDGVIIPGGFGPSGVQGKINAITYARTHNVPFLGLCYGMQLAVVEYARTVCGLTDAHTTEVDTSTPHPVIDILPIQKELLASQAYGGTMRLGAYGARIEPGTRVWQLYDAAQRFEQQGIVFERHRHRYEVNPAYVPLLQQKGLVFCGKHTREDGTTLMEFIEITEHPFFVATQAHPEFKSRLGNPSPLFYGFVRACVTKDRVVAAVRADRQTYATPAI